MFPSGQWRKLSLDTIACEIRILILEQLTSIADLQHTILTCRSLRFTYTEAKELIQLSVRVGQFQQRLSRRDISEACFQTTVHWLQLELTELELYGARAYGARSVGRVDRALERGGAQAVGRQTQ